jgi:hypothetical protein
LRRLTIVVLIGLIAMMGVAGLGSAFVFGPLGAMVYLAATPIVLFKFADYVLRGHKPAGVPELLTRAKVRLTLAVGAWMVGGVVIAGSAAIYWLEAGKISAGLPRDDPRRWVFQIIAAAIIGLAVTWRAVAAVEAFLDHPGTSTTA